MDIVTPLFNQCLVMAVLMGIGYALRRTGLVSDEATRGLGALLLNAVLPVVILRSFWGKFTPERLGQLGVCFFLSLAVLALAMAIARAAYRKDGVAEFAAAFSNAGFIGIPLVEATMGSDSVFYIACLIAELNVLQWTYGKWRLSGSTDSIAPRAILTSPMLIGLTVGIVAFLLRLPVPELAGSVMSSVAGMNSPLAMIILGTYLAKSDVRSLFGAPGNWAASAVRLAAIPLATLALMMLVPAAAEPKLAILIAAAAPAGSNVAIFCQQLGKDTTRASNIVCLSTVLSLATLPMVAALAAAALQV